MLRFIEHVSVVDKMETKEDVLEDVISIDNSAYNVKTLKKNYIMRNLIGIRDEPYMCAAKGYMQRLEFELSQLDYGNGEIRDLRTKWSDLIENELMKDDDFGKQLDNEETLSNEIILQAKNLPDAESKIKLIYNYVRRNLNWNGGGAASSCPRNSIEPP